MRENCTYGLTRGRAHPTRGVPLYSTTPSLFLAQQLELLKLRNSLMASINFRITPPLLPHHWGPTLESPWNLDGTFGILDTPRTDCEFEDFHGHKLDRKALELLRRH